MKLVRSLAWLGVVGGVGVIVFALSVRDSAPNAKSTDEEESSFIFASRVEGRGKKEDALDRFECVRCHHLSNKPGISQDQSCVNCHQGVLRGEYDNRFSEATVARWKSHIQHLVIVPSLREISLRLRRDWTESFLRSPSLVRPHLGAMMPRLKLSESDVQEILAILYTPSHSDKNLVLPTLPDESTVSGESVYREQGCQSCHEFSGVLPRLGSNGMQDFRSLSENVRLAPDLRLVRKRMSKQNFLRWIRNESQFRDEKLMPKYLLLPEQESALIQFLFSYPLKEEPPFVAFQPLPLLSRDVFYPEIEARITKRLCWHCHSKPIPRTGDGGPGNTGGFGFEGAGLDLGSYEGILQGSKRRTREFQSILAKESSGIPRVIEHLIARHSEIQGRQNEKYLGMPLGLPPLPADDIQLFWSWIEQGSRKEPRRLAHD